MGVKVGPCYGRRVSTANVKMLDSAPAANAVSAAANADESQNACSGSNADVSCGPLSRCVAVCSLVCRVCVSARGTVFRFYRINDLRHARDRKSVV